MIPRQATATKLSSILNRRTRLCTYSMQSMATSWWEKPELSELRGGLQSDKAEISVGKGGACGLQCYYFSKQLVNGLMVSGYELF